ncbi:MAG TPA: CDP-glucose 4,6-dehydratase [Bacteroidales bacterium]|jgi:CDP-glucose 4,6-dehydratase|nr:CDP-glucose 4,6-dehydratase [Bacteroidales bacterium]
MSKLLNPFSEYNNPLSIKDPSFVMFKNAKVFVTGHTGFKGSWFLTLLNRLGAEVMGYALEPQTKPSLYDVIGGDHLCKSIIGDIRDAKKLHQSIIDFQPDYIFHLAAQPIVRTSYEIPAETFEVNGIGTANVLDGIRILQKSCIGVMITTDKVYENNETGQAYKESDRLGGHDPYSASKAVAEIIIDSYRKSFFSKYTFPKYPKSIGSGRAGNVIGGGDWAPDRLIPDIVRSLSENKPIEIRNPKAVRPWQHVLEPLSGYLTLASKMTKNPILYGDSFNFGPYSNDVLTVEEMTQKALQIWGHGEFVFPELENQPHEAGLLSLDITKAEKILNWKPTLNAHQALEMSLDWYKKYYNGDPVISLMNEQIDQFFYNEALSN